MPRLLILYTELADYIIHCFTLAEEGFELLLIHWPVNPEAPFQFPNNENYVDKSKIQAHELHHKCLEFKPELVLVSGWVDADYLNICKSLYSKSKIILCMDNQWNGSFRQQLASIMFSFRYKNTFHKAWVSGEKQALFANKLGFHEKDIHTGFYAAKVANFKKFYDKRTSRKPQDSNTKVLLYLGRYIKHKGIFEMWQAFSQLSKQFANWELWCVGTGEEWDNKVIHPKIKHFGFKQPHELEEIVVAADAYILPSFFEPWGVSVHEMAAAGLPMLLSKEVGAQEKFLKVGRNGFSFNPKKPNDLKLNMEKLFALSHDELQKYGEVSVQLAMKLTPETWLQTLNEISES